MSDWLDKARTCKLGTVPASLQVHGADRIEVGRWIRVKDHERGRWFKVKVTRINPDGYFFVHG